MLFEHKDEQESLNHFQTAVKNFVKLKIEDEEILRQALHNLIDKIEVSLDGNLTIHYNFKNPISQGA